MAKKVFTNPQLAHIWANQSQSYGRNQSDTFYFNDSEIYSYGAHYMAAKIYTTPDNLKFALVNEHIYSSSTSKHLSAIRSALQGLMPYYEVSCPYDLNQSIIDSHNAIVDSLFDYLKSNKPYLYAIERLQRAMLTHNELTSLSTNEQVRENYSLPVVEHFGSLDIETVLDYRVLEFIQLEQLKDHAQSVGSESILYLMVEHYLLREKRDAELNTPEMIAKREARAARKEELEQEKLKAQLSEAIDSFNSGEPLNWLLTNKLRSIRPQLIRVKKSHHNQDGSKEMEVQTSGGASVPLRHALRLLRLVNQCTKQPDLDSTMACFERLKGSRIGHFMVDNVDLINKTIKIGCHNISIDHAREVLSPYLERDIGTNQNDNDNESGNIISLVR